MTKGREVRQAQATQVRRSRTGSFFLGPRLLSSAVISALQRSPGTLGATPPVSGVDALSDDDFALALYLCYEVHYRGVMGSDWEWDRTC